MDVLDHLDIAHLLEDRQRSLSRFLDLVGTGFYNTLLATMQEEAFPRGERELATYAILNLSRMEALVARLMIVEAILIRSAPEITAELDTVTDFFVNAYVTPGEDGHNPEEKNG